MISICAALASTYMISQDASAVNRVKSFFDSQPNLKVTMDVEYVSSKVTTKQTYWLVRPNLQKLIVEGPTGTYEMRQNQQETIGYNHPDKTYSLQPSPPVPMPPLDDAPFFVLLGYPAMVSEGGLAAGGISNWKEIAPRPGAWKTVESVTQTVMGPSIIRADVAADGRILAFGGMMAFGDSLSELQFKNIQYETIAGIDRKTFQADLPEGYVPSYIPRRHFTFGAGDMVPVDGWLDAANGKSVEPMSLAGKSGLAILFTAPDCEISQKSRDGYAEVERALKAAGANMIEVSVGGQKPTARTRWRTIWDKDGRIADRLMIEATPHIVFVDADGVCSGYYPGYSDATKAELLRHVKETFDPEEE